LLRVESLRFEENLCARTDDLRGPEFPSRTPTFVVLGVRRGDNQDMPSLSPQELQAARIRSGRLGGRPKQPTRDEARERALDELTPRALGVLRDHLGDPENPNPASWKAALAIFAHAYGAAPIKPSESIQLPESASEIAALSWRELQVVAARLLDEPPPSVASSRVPRQDSL
jgi:hypothetical protein